jgi:hypothetical protein
MLPRSLLEERPTTMSNRVRIASVVFAFALILPALGCGKTAAPAGQSNNPSVSTSSASGASTPPANADIAGRWTADALTQAFTAINQKVGANPADYIKVLITVHMVSVQAINPQKRQNVDQYDNRGTGGVVVTPVDVSSSDPGAVEESAFKSDTVKPDVLVKVMASAVKDSGLDDVKVDVVTVERTFANDPAPVIKVGVKGPRASKAVTYDMNGQFQKVG